MYIEVSRTFLRCRGHVVFVSIFYARNANFRHNFKGHLGLSNQTLNVTWSEFQEGLLNVGGLGMIQLHYTL